MTTSTAAEPLSPVPSTVKSMLQVRNLTKHYGTTVAVDDVSFDVAEGEVCAFLGPNGAGKTTTIQMLTTLLRPTRGTMRIDDVDPVVNPHEARRRFGIVFQDPSVDMELTAFENLHLHAVLYHVPRRIRAERIERLLRLFELWERRAAPVKQFSGGMRRRLEVARGMLHIPRVLFLDEPTLGLDPQSRALLWSKVRELRETERTTVFLTTHYLDEAERIADQVAILDHGRIVAQGSLSDLLRQTGTASLEQAFFSLTGSAVRDERPDSPIRQMAHLARR